ncbi:nuclear GTPase SLIP-GC-like [Melanotaenia boesemani]|uniref:nuclear GTPase SLIP-GC-like n=1 Tax=Melanotaenia boesemani TaxID=1250792 RepID=UPI001C0449B7|nr:nuclear GTPase SLIP-GC-like [Melanotaenia boesemani]
MDYFVCDKLIQWGLSEWIEKFKEQDIDKESLYYLENQDILSLIPKLGPRVKFKRNLELLKREEQNVNEGTEDFSIPHPQHHEDIIHLTEAGPSTSYNGKRKRDSQGETSEWQSPSKRQRDESEAMMLTDVKTVMRNVYVRLRNQDNTKLNTFLKTKISDLETDKRELVGVFGRTGAGKSSLINAVIGEKKLLPTGSVSACTSVMIKVEANRHNLKYEADVEFITEEEWRDELWSINQLNVDNPDSETKSDHDDDHRDIVEKLSALYGDEWKEKTPENLLDNKYFNEIPEFLKSRKKTLICDSAEELSAQFVKYTRNDTKQGEGKEVKRWYWPLVKCVTIRVPNNDLLQHVTIVDLPGNGDRNKSRDEMWKGIVGNCSAVWIVAGIDRAASERESWEILKNVSGLIGNGGECQHIHFICTKSDDIEDLDDRSVDDVRACIFKRNTEAKEAVLQEFGKLHAIKKHFGGDSFKVFTVSSREFLNGRRLNKKSTEIPKLQDFLKNLNDCHSETLNYVSGAHGILSLIQGASCGGATGQKTVVCEHITKKINDHLCPTSEAMLKTYRAFKKCLSEGVETSKRSCERSLKFFLYPRRSGSAFHRILKCVVNNDGIYQPKKGKQLNLNLKLASFLTGSIDEEFRKTFPNEGKHGPFFGVINAFTLDTEGLIQQYNDVKLQLIFLKTEEEKLKTKLKREIRDRKKTIYHSLMETIEKSMQDCYERAAEFSGPGSLLNMRHTIERHVSESKNIMFDQAKKVMLNQLINLMKYIIITLEETMRESIELSLKTDDNLIPDVSAELTMVAKLFDELKRIPEEEMS